MGLAAVHGLIRQHRGWIDVRTAPGEGAAFSIFLPVTSETPSADLPAAPPLQPAQPGATILLVEDEDAVRELVRELIESDGYRVLEAANADAALEDWKEHAAEIDLLFTDMVMPGSANGLELARQLLALKPGLRVIYTSGYSSDLFGGDVPLEDGVNYLPKPYLAHQLTAILRKALPAAATA